MERRIRDYVKYSIAELENYTKAENSCVKKVRNNMHLSLPPSGLADIKTAIQRVITDHKIGFYNRTLNGIVLDVKRIKVLDHAGRTYFHHPQIHLNIEADFYIFQPEIGSVLSGVVKHISYGTIGVVIYRVFSVPVRFKERLHDSIKINSEIEFRIKNFDLKNTLPFIEGEQVGKKMFGDDVDNGRFTEDEFDSDYSQIEIFSQCNKSVVLVDELSSDQETTPKKSKQLEIKEERLTPLPSPRRLSSMRKKHLQSSDYDQIENSKSSKESVKTSPLPILKKIKTEDSIESQEKSDPISSLESSEGSKNCADTSNEDVINNKKVKHSKKKAKSSTNVESSYESSSLNTAKDKEKDGGRMSSMILEEVKEEPKEEIGSLEVSNDVNGATPKIEHTFEEKLSRKRKFSGLMTSVENLLKTNTNENNEFFLKKQPKTKQTRSITTDNWESEKSFEFEEIQPKSDDPVSNSCSVEMKRTEFEKLKQNSKLKRATKEKKTENKSNFVDRLKEILARYGENHKVVQKQDPTGKKISSKTKVPVTNSNVEFQEVSSNIKPENREVTKYTKKTPKRKKRTKISEGLRNILLSIERTARIRKLPAPSAVGEGSSSISKKQATIGEDSQSQKEKLELIRSTNSRLIVSKNRNDSKTKKT